MPKKRNLDDHNKLPKYVYIRRGWYIYRQHLGGGKFAKDIKLCPDTAKLSELHRKYESLTCTAAPEKNIDWLIKHYLESRQHTEKSPKTRKEYEKAAHIISTTPASKSGTLFGQIHIDRISPGVIRKYIDAREKPIAANREIAFLSVCFSWAVERDMAKTNPCKEVRRNSEKARTRYVTDDEYNKVYAIAAPWPHVQCAMELAYLCRMRTCEALDLKKSDITNSGLVIRRRKGSRDNITTWTPRLEAVIKQCENLPKTNADLVDYPLIRGQKGDRLTESGFQTIWQRNIMKTAVGNGMERWTFHDLKAKGISDTEGDKQEASGHRSAAMIDTYNRKLSEVKPSGERQD